MKNSEINISMAEGVKELVIREGEALPLQEPNIIAIGGVIDSPAVWLKQRISTLDQKKCHIIVNREEMTVELVMDEREYYNATITGKLELDPVFVRFGINSGEYVTNFAMAELFKMNRSHFENKDVAMKLVSELQNFKAKCEKEVEKANDNRGNVKLLVAQTVQSNLPDKFNLNIPIFKGTKKQVIEVEVYIRPDDYCCTLISAHANDIIEESRDDLMNAVIKSVVEIAPGIVIIEQ